MKKSFIILGCFLVLAVSGQEIKWYGIEEAFELNKKEPRKIMIDVYTNWCGWCKVMDKNTFGNSIVANYLNSKYYPVKFDAESKDTITINNTDYNFVQQGTRGYHELAAVLLNGQMSYPSVVFLNEEVQVIHIQKGYTAAKPFDEIINFIGGNYYKLQSWEKWKPTYISPIPE